MAYSVMDGTFGLGMMVGPVIGVYLYSIGGFLTPFLVCGMAATVTGVLCVWKCVPVDGITPENEFESSSSILPVLRNASALVSLLSVTTASISVGFVESLLTLYLDIFSLSVLNIGLCFLVIAVIYTLGNTSIIIFLLLQNYLTLDKSKLIFFFLTCHSPILKRSDPSVSHNWLCC